MSFSSKMPFLLISHRSFIKSHHSEIDCSTNPVPSIRCGKRYSLILSNEALVLLLKKRNGERKGEDEGVEVKEVIPYLALLYRPQEPRQKRCQPHTSSTILDL